MTTSNKLLLGLLVTILLFITVMLGIVKYHGVRPHGFKPYVEFERTPPPAVPMPPAPPTPPVPGE